MINHLASEYWLLADPQIYNGSCHNKNNCETLIFLKIWINLNRIFTCTRSYLDNSIHNQVQLGSSVQYPSWKMCVHCLSILCSAFGKTFSVKKWVVQNINKRTVTFVRMTSHWHRPSPHRPATACVVFVGEAPPQKQLKYNQPRPAILGLTFLVP